MLLHEAGRQAAGGELGVRDQPAVERQIVAHPFEHELAQRAAHAGARLLAIPPPHHELREQRVVVDRDLVAAVDAGVVPHPGPLREAHAIDAPRPGEEARERVLGDDARLHRPAARLGGPVAEGERPALGDPDLLGHQVQAGHHLGHRVLDLEPRVDLEKVELAARIEDELDRAGAAVARLLRDPAGRGREALAQRGGEGGRRGLLEQLLMAALDRALALAQADHPPRGVGQDLGLDVPRPLDQLLEVHAIVTEGLQRLAPGERPGWLEVGRLAHHAHPLAAASGRGLEHHREPELLRRPPRLGEASER